MPVIAAMIAVVSTSSVNAEMPANTGQFVSAEMASGQDVVWHDDFKSGWQLARKTNRPMVIFITSKRCHFCDAMKTSTWCNDGVLKKLKQKFVAIQLTPERNAETLERISVPAFPTTLIGHPDGHIIDHRIGFQPPESMQTFLQEFEQPVH